MGGHSATQVHGRLRHAGHDESHFLQHGYLPVPRLVQWMVTLKCPLACMHCLSAPHAPGKGTHDARKARRPAGELSLKQARRFVEEVGKLGVEELLLTGGEPLARPDLAEIIGMLRAHRIRWSLNTAIMPGRRLRTAMEKWPPVFVAVSLDGPEKIHDGFRRRRGAYQDALRSIGYFSDLPGVNVAVGTTVTTRNIHCLSQTFGAVMGSGAGSWGLHLLVPEGRARTRRDLFLSRRQLKKLMRFCAPRGITSP